MKELKKYQEKAINKMLSYLKIFIEQDDIQKFVLESPTGSGKTFMMSKAIERMSKELNESLCFIWISVGKGNLHEQSYLSVKNEISNINSCSLADKVYDGNKTMIDENEIVFVNWDKINEKDEDGNWINFLMKDKEKSNLRDVINTTKNNGRKIILIIDESHYGATSERSLEIIYEIINPSIIIEMSATPIIDHPDGHHKITPIEVKEEEMIKNDIIINKDLENIYEISSDNDSTMISLEAAYNKRLELKKLYEENGVSINPLVLIQIPNKDAGDDKKNIVEQFLFDKNINYENGKLYAWLDKEEKTHISLKERMTTIVPFDSNVEFLIFKQAIDTGWDCPRAHILVKFRETKSVIFSTQTLGRILRMPEAKFYDSSELNTAYVYTNIEKEKMKIENEIIGGTVIKRDSSLRRIDYNNISLSSYIKPRDSQGDIDSQYYEFFDKHFCEYFDIDKNQIINLSDNFLKLQDKEINIDPEIKNALLTNGVIPSEKIDDIKVNEINFGNLFGLKISEDDLQYKFISIIAGALNGFPPVRSIPTVRTAIFRTFKKRLNISMANGGAIYSQSLVVGNEKKFFQILDTSIKDYKEFKVKEENKNAKASGKIIENWEIPEKIYYNSDSNIIVPSLLSVHQPLTLRKKANGNCDKLEVEFINYLEQNKEYIEWFWKNGDDAIEMNFGIPKEDGHSFQPDFIIKFKNGSIGIFDTKDITHDKLDTLEKSNALYKYITEQRNNGKNVFGGIVIKDPNNTNKNVFRLFEGENYISFDEDNSLWNYFDNLFE